MHNHSFTLNPFIYSTFGMVMPGRAFNSGDYRYGFNGKENDNEVKGTGNQQDYGFRIYDPRLGKFLSVDPLQKDFPWWTPYQFTGNTPIQAVDLDGREPVFVHGTWSDPETFSKPFIKRMTDATGWKGTSPILAKWSGGNSRNARTMAANDIVRQLTSSDNMEKMEAAGHGKHATLIAHSHGGNVAKMVKKKLVAQGWTVDMVNIETPQRKDYETTKGDGKNINFYSSSDAVQSAGTYGYYDSPSGPGSQNEVMDMEDSDGARTDRNADVNIKLSPSGGLYNWFKNSGGHSLHNDPKASEQIISNTESVFGTGEKTKAEEPKMQSAPTYNGSQ